MIQHRRRRPPANRSKRRFLFAAMAFAAGASAHAQELPAVSADTSLAAGHPHWWDADELTSLMQEYAVDGLVAHYVGASTDASYARYVLGAKETPYSDVANVKLGASSPQLNRAMAMLSIASGPVTQRQVHEWKVWDLGYTKLGPILAAPVPDELKEFKEGVPHVMKAGLDPDIYKASLLWTDVLGHPTIVANYALALQVLRDKLARTPRALWYERNLRVDVMGRFLDATMNGNPTHSDFHYLVQLLDGELSTWRPVKTNRYGFRQLAGPFRVAHIAAALNERLNHGSYTCARPGKPDYSVAGMGGEDTRDLCFSAATDRAIHAWYVGRWILEVMAFGGEAWTAELQNELASMVVPLLASSQGAVGRTTYDQMHGVTSLETNHLKVANYLLSEARMSTQQGDALVKAVFTSRCEATR